MKRRVEHAFLPAAIEIEETPPNPAGRAIVWAISGFFVASIAWATVSEVDTVAIARGRIIPSGYSKPVQVLRAGVVSAIHVAEGAWVESGELLLELDSAVERAELGRLDAEHSTVVREIERLQALDARLAVMSAPARPVVEDDAEELVRHRWREFTNRLAVLERESDRLDAERQSARQQVAKLESLLEIAAKRAITQKRLLDSKMLSEDQFLLIERERLELLHDGRSHEARVEELGLAIAEVGTRIRQARLEFQTQVSESLEDAEARRQVLIQELAKARAREAERSIVAPVSGRVQQLAVHHVGAIATPAMDLMIVVPDQAPLEVEAWLENRDIGFVRAGQAVAIKVDTFPFTKYGTVGGEVVGLSEDAVQDEQQGAVYAMRVAMHANTMLVRGTPVALVPGMSVSVEATTGKRRVIEFLLGPLLRMVSESARER